MIQNVTQAVLPGPDRLRPLEAADRAWTSADEAGREGRA